MAAFGANERHYPRMPAPDLFAAVPEQPGLAAQKRADAAASSSRDTFLPPIKKASNVQSTLPDAERVNGVPLHLKASRAEQREAQKKVTALQKKLRRSATEASQLKHRQRKRTEVEEMQADMQERVGKRLAMQLEKVSPASAEVVLGLSEKMNAQLEKMYPFHPDRRQWFRLFKAMDEDGSGRIGYQELAWMVREKLHMSAKALSEPQLQAVWRALDTDGSGWLSAGCAAAPRAPAHQHPARTRPPAEPHRALVVRAASLASSCGAACRAPPGRAGARS